VTACRGRRLFFLSLFPSILLFTRYLHSLAFKIDLPSRSAPLIQLVVTTYITVGRKYDTPILFNEYSCPSEVNDDYCEEYRQDGGMYTPWPKQTESDNVEV